MILGWPKSDQNELQSQKTRAVVFALSCFSLRQSNLRSEVRMRDRYVGRAFDALLSSATKHAKVIRCIFDIFFLLWCARLNGDRHFTVKWNRVLCVRHEHASETNPFTDRRHNISYLGAWNALECAIFGQKISNLTQSGMYIMIPFSEKCFFLF